MRKTTTGKSDAQQIKALKQQLAESNERVKYWRLKWRTTQDGWWARNVELAKRIMQLEARVRELEAIKLTDIGSRQEYDASY